MITAALVTFNRVILLQEVLDSLLNQTGPDKVERICVVDNASSDATAEFLKAYQRDHGDRIQVKTNATNEGGAAGFSAAIAMAYDAGATWVWVLDDDAIPKRDALSKLMDSNKAADESTGGLGCLVLDVKGGLFLPNLQCKVDRNAFQFTAVLAADTSPDSTMPREINIDTCSFVGLLLHRRAIKACGLPNAQYFIWFDDIEYSLRVSNTFKLWLVPEAQVIHKAHPRDYERKHWLFDSKIADYPYADCWRMYYGTRNRHVVARLNSSRFSFYKGFIKHTVKELLSPLLFQQDHAVERMRISLLAAVHGYKGRLGKTVALKPPFLLDKDQRT